jgi:3',5'-cyclic-AMP phosphodiesterase
MSEVELNLIAQAAKPVESAMTAYRGITNYVSLGCRLLGGVFRFGDWVADVIYKASPAYIKLPTGHIPAGTRLNVLSMSVTDRFGSDVSSSRLRRDPRFSELLGQARNPHRLIDLTPGLVSELEDTVVDAAVEFFRGSRKIGDSLDRACEETLDVMKQQAPRTYRALITAFNNYAKRKKIPGSETFADVVSYVRRFGTKSQTGEECTNGGAPLLERLANAWKTSKSCIATGLLALAGAGGAAIAKDLLGQSDAWHAAAETTRSGDASQINIIDVDGSQFYNINDSFSPSISGLPSYQDYRYARFVGNNVLMSSEIEVASDGSKYNSVVKYDLVVNSAGKLVPVNRTKLLGAWNNFPAPYFFVPWRKSSSIGSAVGCYLGEAQALPRKTHLADSCPLDVILGTDTGAWPHVFEFKNSSVYISKNGALTKVTSQQEFSFDSFELFTDGAPNNIVQHKLVIVPTGLTDAIIIYDPWSNQKKPVALNTSAVISGLMPSTNYKVGGIFLAQPAADNWSGWLYKYEPQNDSFVNLSAKVSTLPAPPGRADSRVLYQQEIGPYFGSLGGPLGRFAWFNSPNGVILINLETKERLTLPFNTRVLAYTNTPPTSLSEAAKGNFIFEDANHTIKEFNGTLQKTTTLFNNTFIRNYRNGQLKISSLDETKFIIFNPAKRIAHKMPSGDVELGELGILLDGRLFLDYPTLDSLLAPQPRARLNAGDSFVHISDTHIGMIFSERGINTGAEKRLENIVAEINNITPPPKAVFISGDVSDAGASTLNVGQTEPFGKLTYSAFLGILSKSKVPWYAVPGNHDSRIAEANPVFGGLDNFKRVGNESFVVDYGNVVVLGMYSGSDLLGPGRSLWHPQGDGFTDTQISWLEGQLKNASAQGKRVMIVAHHPIIADGNLGQLLDENTIGINQARFLALLKQYGVVDVVATGHTHRSSGLQQDGTIFEQAASTAVQEAYRVVQFDGSRLVVKPTARLHDLIVAETGSPVKLTLDGPTGDVGWTPDGKSVMMSARGAYFQSYPSPSNTIDRHEVASAYGSDGFKVNVRGVADGTFNLSIYNNANPDAFKATNIPIKAGQVIKFTPNWPEIHNETPKAVNWFTNIDGKPVAFQTKPTITGAQFEAALKAAQSGNSNPNAGPSINWGIPAGLGLLGAMGVGGYLWHRSMQLGLQPATPRGRRVTPRQEPELGLPEAPTVAERKPPKIKQPAETPPKAESPTEPAIRWDLTTKDAERIKRVLPNAIKRDGEGPHIIATEEQMARIRALVNAKGSGGEEE